MKKFYIIILFICLAAFLGQAQQLPADKLPEKTSFQIGPGWAPEYDVRSDVTMIYGIGGNFSERVKSWRDHGYNVQFMTGIAWGEYQNYFLGNFDGKTHWEEGQVEQNGSVIWHGKNVPYIVPTDSYLTYFKTIIKKVIDEGINTIYLEEPEFWARAGYSESFKNEWQKYYGFPWMPQHESPEATYLSSKLKYHLYFNALKEVFRYAKTYGAGKGLNVRCFVPTHSLLNYSSWQIVSPEASLASLNGMDGYIAQVWTGTAREPNYFNGVKKERVFETAFLEYGTMESMTAPTGRKMYFLTDPIEDWPRTWDDYKINYQKTFTAEIMYPMVDNFEVMPWPNRIYLGKFKLKNNDTPQPISPTYATQMQVMVNSLNDMPLSSNRINGTKGIGVLLGNSMMFQRFPTHKDYSDPQLSNLYGMVLPLLKRGVPVEMVHMENLGYPSTLKDIKTLIMSYANMKPLSPDVHKYIAGWVKNGGVLIYYGKDDDPFQQVKEWWNTSGNNYKSPSIHLFELMGIKPEAGKEQYAFGAGKVYIVRKDPKELVLEPGQDEDFINLVKKAYEQDAKAGSFETKNYFYLERGPYDIAAVMDENADTTSLKIKGPVIDLFNPELPVLSEKIVHPGEEAYLYDLSRIKDKQQPKVLCAASRVYEEKAEGNTYSFVTKSPSGTINVMRIILPGKPVAANVTDADHKELKDLKTSWDSNTNTYLLQFKNDCNGIRVELKW